MRNLCQFRALTLLVLVMGLAWAGLARAHEVRPALLDIRETGDGWFDVAFKRPMLGGDLPDIAPLFPDDVVQIGNPVRRQVKGAILETSRYRTDAGTIVGMQIEIEGLKAQQIDVLVQITLANGVSHSAILKPSEPGYIIPDAENSWAVVSGYTVMGIGHILSGFDHLLFVLALILLIRGRWMLLKAITAFTVAHSITLALATLGVVSVPSKPTEAVIALSIVFLAVEVLRKSQGSGGIAVQSPWIVTFGFGLFHGLGFAGALSDVGLPQHAIPLALLSFNVGVEIGQVMFVAAVLALVFVVRKAGIKEGFAERQFAPYVIGCMAAYWVIERTLAILPLSI